MFINLNKLNQRYNAWPNRIWCGWYNMLNCIFVNVDMNGYNIYIWSGSPVDIEIVLVVSQLLVVLVILPPVEIDLFAALDEQLGPGPPGGLLLQEPGPVESIEPFLDQKVVLISEGAEIIGQIVVLLKLELGHLVAVPLLAFRYDALLHFVLHLLLSCGS